MCELKCPFCGKYLTYNGEEYDCPNAKCKKSTFMFGTKELWEELTRTRKALKIAKGALKKIDKTRSLANHKIGTQDKTLNSGNVFCWATPDEIHNAIKQITVLEQKGE